MTEYGSNSTQINNLQWLGTVEGSDADTSETSVGTLTIGAGTFKSNDKIWISVLGNCSGSAGAFKVRIKPSANINNLDVGETGITGDFEAEITSQIHVTGTDIGLSMMNGVRGAATAIRSLGTVDFNTANWITSNLTVSLLLTGDAVAGTTTASMDVYRVRGA